MFLDWKTQYSQNGNSSKTDPLKNLCNLYQNTRFFWQKLEVNPEIYVEVQSIEQSKNFEKV